MKKNITQILIICCIAVGVVSISRATENDIIIESDWLETEIGSEGELIGAKVIGIESEPESQVTIVKIDVPIEDLANIEQVEIIGKNPKEKIKQTKKAELLENYEKGTYGYRLFINRPGGFEFRLRLIDTGNNIDRSSPAAD